ncbi:MAG: peptidoglycan bridge formation glycyltransferase FemA/FemB family protein, partial [Bifidobacteriaceae bacterium]|nr:peptidoglycan bridge formation glycyltransferase FemA/FemB family protein [Bifidobacteriaceae bacterium]
MPPTARPISAAEHLAWIDANGPVSFLQTPAWGSVKREWRHECVGLFEGDRQVGAALMLMRPMPVAGYCLAYVPEGPALTFLAADGAPTPSQATAVGTRAAEHLTALIRFAEARRAFALTVGPALWRRRWHAPTVKKAMAGDATRLEDVAPDESNPIAGALARTLTGAGWRPPAAHAGFAAGQPDYVFQVPLAGRSEADVLAGFNQLWRRNIRKADAAGVEVARGVRADLAAFHALYLETAERDRFTPRPLEYFERMRDALTAETPDRLTLYLARHASQLAAAAIAIRVPGHTWYSYGASSTRNREVRGSNAIQWAMVRDAIVRGDRIYDMRGITGTLDPADPHVGLVQFKVGTGGYAQQYFGEWTAVIRPVIHRAFQLAMARRGQREGQTMALVLHVDMVAWRGQIDALAAARPGMIPVNKGNGYGFGTVRLARVAPAHGFAHMAVGTAEEATAVE